MIAPQPARDPAHPDQRADLHGGTAIANSSYLEI
jgi:hypothetical protein